MAASSAHAGPAFLVLTHMGGPKGLTKAAVGPALLGPCNSSCPLQSKFQLCKGHGPDIREILHEPPLMHSTEADLHMGL